MHNLNIYKIFHYQKFFLISLYITFCATNTFAQPDIVDLRGIVNNSSTPRVELSWTDLAGANEYIVLRGNSETTITESLDTIANPNIGFIDNTVELDQIYFYHIISLNADPAPIDTSNFIAVVPVGASELDRVGTAITFSGGTQSVDFGTNDTLNLANGDAALANFTIQLWVKAEKEQSSPLELGILSKRASAIGATPYSLTMNGLHGRLTFTRGDGTDFVTLTSGKSINDGIFHHVAIVKTGGTIEMYVDGLLQDSDNNVDGVSTGNTFLGTTQGGTSLTGAVDELSFWSRTFSAEEILNIFSGADGSDNPRPYVGTETDLIGLWHFDEGTGNVAYDAVFNYSPGTVNGGGYEESTAMFTNISNQIAFIPGAPTIPTRHSSCTITSNQINTGFGTRLDNTIDPSFISIQGSISGNFEKSTVIVNTDAGGNSTGSVSATLNNTPLAGELISITGTGQIKGLVDDANPLLKTLIKTPVYQFVVEPTGGEGRFVDIGDTYGSSNSNAVALGDIDGDGFVDAVFANEGANTGWTGSPDNDGSFNGGSFALGGSDSRDVALGDFDLDGDLDVIFTNFGAANQIRLNEGGGTFLGTAANIGGETENSNAVALGDLNGDGYLDAYIANETADSIYFGNTDGSFSNSGYGYGAGNTTGVALGDIDNDADLDVIVSGASTLVYLNNGHGILDQTNTFDLGVANTNAVQVGRMNDDDSWDIVVVAQDKIDVFLNDNGNLNPGAGRFVLDATGDSGEDIVAGDFNGDGLLDLFTINNGTSNRIWLNNAGSSFTQVTESFGTAFGSGAAIADLNGDGALDAFVANGSAEAGEPNVPLLNGGCELRDRIALTSFFNTTGGSSSWTTSTNWGTEEPLDTWYGVQINSQGCVSNLDLSKDAEGNAGNGIDGSFPDIFWNLADLVTLNLADNTVRGSLASQVGNLSRLTEINLSNNSLSGSIPVEIENLESLSILNLSGNSFSGNIPDFPTEEGKLASLTTLNLSDNRLSGSIPANFLQLTSLLTLDLSDNLNPFLSGTGLSGDIPEITTLQFLDLSGNLFSGSVPTTLTNLVTLNLANNQYEGTNVFPDDIGNLSNLQFLNVEGNGISQLPDNFGGLTSLQELRLGNNSFADSIPAILFDLNNLTLLHLNNNAFTGAIPTRFVELSQLTSLDISSNQISGNIPEELTQLSRLTFLSIAQNDLTGTLSEDFTNLTNLEVLRINGNVDLSGPVPGSFPLRFSNLTEFNFANTGICEPENSTYITWTETLTTYISNGLPCPECIEQNRLALTEFYQSMGGDFWVTNTNWNSERSLGSWFGVTTDAVGCVTELNLNENNLANVEDFGDVGFDGILPENIRNLTELERLDLGRNAIRGELPSTIFDFPKLTYMDLSNNQLTGTIPTNTIPTAQNLAFLDLSNNLFEGDIPLQLMALPSLQSIILNVNSFTTLPNNFNSSQVEVFEANANNITEVPDEVWLADSLIRLDLSNNDLDIQFPDDSTAFNLTNLQVLKLDNNLITDFPSQIGRLTRLTELEMQNNLINDSIPTAIGNLNNMVRLVLNNNNLIGGLPQDIGNLVLLEQLTLNNNPQLFGQIPLTITNLDSLKSFEFNETNLCEPDDDDFRAWRDNIISNAGRYVGTIICPACLEEDRTALITFFEEMGGENWTNTTNDFQVWEPENLDKTVNTWFGVTVDSVTGCVIGLDLSNSTGEGNDGNNLQGSISTALGSLVELRFLNLSNNDSLDGGIPVELANNINLEQLSLNGLSLTGQIPLEIYTLEKLDTLDLGNNALIDTLSREIVNLRNIVYLDLGNNNISGSIPIELANLENATHIRLDSARLSGEVPAQLEDLENLITFDISNNQITFLPNLTRIRTWGLLENGEGLRVGGNFLDFGSIEPNAEIDSTQFFYNPQSNLPVDPATYVIVEGQRLEAPFEANGEFNQYQWFKLEQDSILTAFTEVSDTSTLIIPSVVEIDSGQYVLQITNTFATDLTLQTAPIRLIVAPAIVNITKIEESLAPSPLIGSDTAQAVIGFALTSSGNPQLTGITINANEVLEERFTGYRLFESLDSSFLTQDDNREIEGLTFNEGIGQIEITGILDSLDTIPRYYFFAVDVDSAVNRETRTIEFDFDSADVQLTFGLLVLDTSFTSIEYAFAGPPEIAVFGNDSLIANNDTIPILENFTDLGFAQVGGDSLTRSYSIVNFGDTTLNLTGEDLLIEIIGDEDQLFGINQQPPSSVQGQDTAFFTISYIAIDTLVRTATISISNDDRDENPYTFLVQARGSTPPILTFTGSTVLCEGDSLILAADDLEEIEGFIWQHGNDTISFDSTLVIPMVIDSVHSGTNYSLTLLKDTYSYTSDTFEVVINPLPLSTFDVSTDFRDNTAILCFGDSLTLIADEPEADEYIWRRGTEEIGLDSILVFDSFQDTSRVDYTLTVMKNGCITMSDTFEIRVRDQPMIGVLGSPTICEGDVLFLESEFTENIRTYTWMWGDSIVSTDPFLEIPNLVDSLTGIYSLTVDSAFCTNRVEFEVTTLPQPNLEFDGETNVCEQQSLALTALEMEADSILWLKSDTIVVATGATFSIDSLTLTDAGDYTLTIFKAGTACEGVRNFTVNVNPTPPVVINGEDSVCALSQVYTYSAATSGNIYDWVIEGGEIIGGFDTTVVFIPDTIFVDTTFTVIDTVTMESIMIDSTITVVEFDTVTTVGLLNQIEVVWSDTVSEGKLFLSETILYEEDSTFSCILTDTLEAAITPFLQPILLGPLEVCEFSTGIVYASQRIENEYRWEVTGGTIVEGDSTAQILVDWGSEGIGTVTLFETLVSDTLDITACPVPITIDVTKFSDPMTTIDGPTAVCEGAEEIAYSANTLNGNYTWTVIGGVIISDPDSSTILVNWGPASETQGSIRLEQSFGTGESCVTDTTVNIDINVTPEARIIGTRLSCEFSEEVIYTAADTTADLYFWRVTNGSVSGPLNNFEARINFGEIDSVLVDSVATPAVTTIELTQVFLYDTFGIECVDSDIIEINLGGENPMASFQNPPRTPAGISARFEDTSTSPDPIVAWDWDFGDGTREGSTEQNPAHVFDSPGVFEVTLTITDQKSCTSTISNFIEISPRRDDLPPLSIMNIITPNNDGQNDFLYITNLEEFPDNEVVFINRYGSEVFSQIGYKNDWEATWNDAIIPPGTYVCVVKVATIDENGNEVSEIIKENVTVIR